MVEVALSPDLQRGFSEVERLRVGFGFMERSVFPPLGSLQSSSSWSGGDGSRHSQVSSGRRDSGGHSLLSRVLHSLFEMEVRLKADVIVNLRFRVLLSFSPVQGTGPLVLKGQGCVDGFSGVIAFYEPASRHSSHPGTVVFYGGVADFLAGVVWRFVHSGFVVRKALCGNVKGTPGIRGNEENLTFRESR
ncbi:hypothetical protein DY000_02024799 [Brassica cretica]|uniref:Uncharacterized protein n=1 Tax=Brassica cretica TaxID=69181 RepID=A0ABQ7EHS9_BRACR|nr:hypothetical protein DY000_02024799 [Brassica cretica]